MCKWLFLRQFQLSSTGKTWSRRIDLRIDSSPSISLICLVSTEESCHIGFDWHHRNRRVFVHGLFRRQSWTTAKATRRPVRFSRIREWVDRLKVKIELASRGSSQAWRRESVRWWVSKWAWSEAKSCLERSRRDSRRKCRSQESKSSWIPEVLHRSWVECNRIRCRVWSSCHCTRGSPKINQVGYRYPFQSSFLEEGQPHPSSKGLED